MCKESTLEYMSAVSQVWIPASHAAFNKGKALSSFNTQSAQVSEPYDMQPRTAYYLRRVKELTDFGDLKACLAQADIFHGGC